PRIVSTLVLLVLAACGGSDHFPTMPSACTNGVKDGVETDVDCGGSVCGPCAAGKACAVTTDCVTGSRCASGVCVSTALCSNGALDAGETDVDCGGSTCPPCATGKRCQANTDCA